MDEEQKDMYQRVVRLRFQAQLFKTSEFYQKGLQMFVQSTVIKYPRVWQSLFYLLRVPRE